MIFSKLKLMCAVGAVFLCVSASAAQKDDFKAAEKAASGVITRTLGRKPSNVKLVVTGPLEGGEYFSTEVRKGKLTVKGSSAVAVCRGFYDYVTSNHYGLSTWTVNNIDLPENLMTSRSSWRPLLLRSDSI